MPHTAPMLAVTGLGLLLVGCAVPVADSTEALVLDAGPALVDTAPLEAAPCTFEEPEVTCTVGYPLFLCNGSCPGGTLCCVTGARPLGVCRTLDGCSDQCAYDCGMVGQTSGPRAQAICEAWCVAVAPDVACER